jgi:hypothetical protein
MHDGGNATRALVRQIDADQGRTSIDPSWPHNVNVGYHVARKLGVETETALVTRHGRVSRQGTKRDRHSPLYRPVASRSTEMTHLLRYSMPLLQGCGGSGAKPERDARSLYLFGRPPVLDLTYFTPHRVESPARARGCWTCTNFQGGFFCGHVLCEREPRWPRVVGVPRDGCGFWQREPGADDD